MKKFLIPIDITLYAKDEFHKNQQIQEFLRKTFREYAASYNITDYEIRDELTIESK